MKQDGSLVVTEVMLVHVDVLCAFAVGIERGVDADMDLAWIQDSLVVALNICQ